MDIYQLMTQALISTLCWLILLFIVVETLKSAFVKGAVSELYVNLAAKFFLDKHVYKLFKNVTLATEDGSTQIDHIIVSRYGVFVIETKAIKGWIFGSTQQKTWIQKIYRHTSKFQNPLHQNYNHTQTLQTLLGIDPDKVISLIVFVGDCTFKTTVPDNVVSAGHCIRFIKSKTHAILSDDEVLAICSKIQDGQSKPSFRTHIDHVKHIKAMAEKRQPQDDILCPKCGKKMILRSVRRNNNQGKQFLGCSNYPKCKMVRQII